MTEAVLALIPAYGAAVLFALSWMSCVGFPVPGTLGMLAAGSFVASGDLSLPTVLAAALAGAIIGDQTGYWLGSLGGERVLDRLERRPGFREPLSNARRLSARWGVASVFLSRWLVAPLGPTVNVLSGLIGMRWSRFTLSGVSGEAVWVTLYVGLGYGFSRSIVEIAEVLGDLTWFLAAVVVSLGLAFRLRLALRRREARRAAAPVLAPAAPLPLSSG